MKRILIFLLLTTLMSCNTVYNGRHDFVNLVWDKNKTLYFNFNIKQDNHYDIYITLRYIVGYPYKNMILKASLNNKESILNIPIINKNNEYTGEVIGDFADKEILWLEDTLLKKGNYNVVINQETIPEKLPFIGDVGVKVIINSD